MPWGIIVTGVLVALMVFLLFPSSLKGLSGTGNQQAGQTDPDSLDDWLDDRR